MFLLPGILVLCERMEIEYLKENATEVVGAEGKAVGGGGDQVGGLHRRDQEDVAPVALADAVRNFLETAELLGVVDYGEHPDGDLVRDERQDDHDKNHDKHFFPFWLVAGEINGDEGRPKRDREEKHKGFPLFDLGLLLDLRRLLILEEGAQVAASERIQVRFFCHLFTRS